MEKKTRYLSDFKVQAKDLVLPLYILGHEPAGAFAKWMFDVTQMYPDSVHRQLGDDLRRVATEWIAAIDHYQFPVVTLSSRTTAEAVCTIFETVNRTGIQLSPFELLAARYFAKGIDIRDLWFRACVDHPLLAEYAVEPYAALQSIALATSRSSCSYVDVLALDADTVEKAWPSAIEGLAKSLEILQEDCGVASAKWLPYSTMLAPMSAVLVKSRMLVGLGSAGQRQKLVQWFWCSVFSSAYDSSTNSKAANDTKQLLAWLSGGQKPKIVTDFAFDPRILRSTWSPQSALYKAVFALLLSRKPRDFYSKAPIDRKVMRDGTVEDHHIFPRGYLKQLKGLPKQSVDSVLNRTLIDGITNRAIADRPPSVYLKEIRSRDGERLLDQTLASHLLPQGANSLLMRDGFLEFIAWRQDAIWREVQRVTGVSQVADLIIE